MIKKKQKSVDLILLTLTIIVGIASYILNLGWIRIIFSIPFLAYNVIMLSSGIIYVRRNNEKRNIKRRMVFYLSLLTYILFNVFLYDGGDIGPAYCFFGLIKIYGEGSFFYYTSMISLIISLICIVLNTIVFKEKKAMD